MISNMGTTDRVVRFLIALGLAVLYFTDTVSGITAVAFGIVAVLFSLTSLVGWCPAYVPFHFSTRKTLGGRPSPA